METNIRQDNNEEVEIDIMQIIRMLLSKIWIVIVAGVVTAIIAFGITEIAITPQYQSSIKLYIINRQALLQHLVIFSHQHSLLKIIKFL